MKFYMCLFLAVGSLVGHSQIVNDRDVSLSSKNFYIVTVLEKVNQIKSVLPKSNLKSANIADYKFSLDEISYLKDALREAYGLKQKQIDLLMDKEVRPSGSYTLYHKLSNQELWLKCWDRYFTTVNYCIDVYGLGKKIRYPAIDSASYQVESKKYQQMMSEMLNGIAKNNKVPFYEIRNKVVLGLLALNGRDEAVRYEPLSLKENRSARKKLSKTKFSAFSYTAIVVPGEGPEQYGIRISDASKKRCRLAVERFKLQQAPFIIVSGGNCHPFRTEFNEAEEMKRFLVDSLKVPASAVIMDPHARHTTTNFRNASRYLIEYGFPLDRPTMLVTTMDQADYIANPKFGERNIKELGYLPYKDLKRLSALEFSFFVNKEVLTRDAVDPLDP